MRSNSKVLRKYWEQAGLVVSMPTRKRGCGDVIGGNFEAVLMDIQMPVMGGLRRPGIEWTRGQGIADHRYDRPRHGG